MVSDYFTMENFGTKPLESVQSETAIKARKKLKRTTKKKKIEAGLLWKNAEFDYQDSYSITLNRLENVERKLKNNKKS